MRENTVLPYSFIHHLIRFPPKREYKECVGAIIDRPILAIAITHIECFAHIEPTAYRATRVWRISMEIFVLRIFPYTGA